MGLVAPEEGLQQRVLVRSQEGSCLARTDYTTGGSVAALAKTPFLWEECKKMGGELCCFTKRHRKGVSGCIVLGESLMKPQHNID